MKTNSIVGLSYTTRNNKYVAALIVYEDSPIFHDDEFLEYISKVMTKIGKTANYSSELLIFTDKAKFILDAVTLKFEMEFKNQLIFFTDGELTSILEIDELLEEFKKLSLTNDK